MFNKNEWKSDDVAQLGERQTEDLKVPGSIPGDGKASFFFSSGGLYRPKTLDFLSKVFLKFRKKKINLLRFRC